MDLITLQDLQIMMLIGTFLLGCVTFMIGVAILINGAWGKDIRTATTHTTRLVQKGLAEEISGLVGNASTLLSTLNDMSRTSAGIGVFLTVFGGLLMGVTCWFVLVMD